ncbi:hypothetical protein [Thioclava pacifica]|uniref:Uncharacterized protein n=1 Tax=Thioclava pacifica DSM 10166 TaxID=1353537 RepID=A0A074JVR3_9RHOB|nr:hypothetical protein [Thioclava pacifica]KEO53442.1 hypothetical protein TP2_17785 [Thioclava pacifica DSM 10166]
MKSEVTAAMLNAKQLDTLGTAHLVILSDDFSHEAKSVKKLLYDLHNGLN